ncbi:MAG: T9SS type A sorting domain-containing protein [Bacteroidales bacterium]|nr:MAG: T9SS type A sorting domain-containing protein [Bacteroidales bacterium]
MKTLVTFLKPNVMKAIFTSILAVSLMVTSVNAQYLNSVEKLESVSASRVQTFLQNNGIYNLSMVINTVHVYKITYNTIDVFGDPTVASGALYVPVSCHDTLPMVSYQHYTVLERSQVPSNRYNETDALLYSGNGYITVLPDYLGMGDNPGIQPYVHWESEATASIDLIRAAREFLNDSLHIWDNKQLFIAGYSVGGHATMAMHKYIQTHNLQTEFNVSASTPMSGPYALSYDELDLAFNEDATYPVPFYLTMLFASYQYVYGNLYSDYNQYYDPPYASVIASWVASGNYEYGYLPKNLYDFMQDSVVDNIMDNPNHPVRIACRKNDLHNWPPQEPVRMLYCGMDKQVTPQNAITAQDTMIALGAPDVQAIEISSSGNHSSCWRPSYLYSLEWFDSFLPEKYSDIIDNHSQEFNAHASWSNGTIVDTIEVSEYYSDIPLAFSLNDEAFQINPQTGILTVKNSEYLNTDLPIRFTVKVYREECNTIEETVKVTINISGVSTESNRIDDLMEIFPNPTTNILIIKTNILGQYSVEINSLNGQLILSREIEGSYHQLDLSSFRKGVYFITIRSKDFVTTRKIIKL